MIDSLLYLIASRSNTAYAIGVYAHYQSAPLVSHLYSIKRILKYILNTFQYAMWYSFDTNSTLVRYYDANWAGCSEDRKSTYGGSFFLDNNLIAWFSKKQNGVSLSTTEEEYIAATSSYKQMLWMSKCYFNMAFFSIQCFYLMII